MGWQAGISEAIFCEGVFVIPKQFKSSRRSEIFNFKLKGNPRRYAYYVTMNKTKRFHLRLSAYLTTFIKDKIETN